MKRMLSLMLAVVILLSLCGCGKTKAATEAENAIAAIGTVTLDSEEAILYAEKLYGILTDKEKESIENRVALVDARDAYEKLVQQEQERLAKEAEAARLAVLEAAVPEMDAFVAAAKSIIWNFEFVTKYAGNVNGNGSRKFADSFVETLKAAFDNVNFDPINEAFPELHQQAKTIADNTQMVVDLLKEMGRTNSTSNVSTMKDLSFKTVQLIKELEVNYQDILKEAGLAG